MLSKKAQEIQERYNLNYVRIDQLKKYVQLQVITAEEYKLICKEDYITTP